MNDTAVDELKRIIRENSSSVEEREDHWHIVDEIVDASFINSVLDELPNERKVHEEFLEIYTTSPNDEGVVFGYLEKTVGSEVTEKLKSKVNETCKDLLKDLFPDREIKIETQSESKPPVK